MVDATGQVGLAHGTGQSCHSCVLACAANCATGRLSAHREEVPDKAAGMLYMVL